MAIMPSQRLGPCEIFSSIGAPGMGEVNRARDNCLNRFLAIRTGTRP